MRILFLGDVVGRSGRDAVAAALPGLRARLMAEQIQKIFAVRVAEFAAGSGQGKAAAKAACAMGIACADQGGRPTPEELLGKAAQATNDALAQKHGHICVADGAALEARNTLVLSSEKRFLFFGGN